jgi:hypothetical protein
VLGAPKLGQPSNEKQRSEQTAEIESIVRELAVEMKLRILTFVPESP